MARGSCEGRSPMRPSGFCMSLAIFGEVAVGRHADGAAQSDADVLVDGLLDLEGDLAGAWRLLLAADELADHLVDGGRVGDGAARSTASAMSWEYLA